MLELIILIVLFTLISLVVGILTSFSLSAVAGFFIASSTIRDTVIEPYSKPYFDDTVSIQLFEEYLNYVTSILIFNIKLVLPVFAIYGVTLPIFSFFEYESVGLVVMLLLPVIYLTSIWIIYLTPIIKEEKTIPLSSRTEFVTVFATIIPYTIMFLVGTFVSYVFVFGYLLLLVPA